MGVRVALGASRGAMVGLVVGPGMRPGAIGAVAGLGGVWALERFVRSLLYGVKPSDPVSLGAAIVILLGAGIVGCLAPAIKAARMDPGGALRE